MYRNWQIVIEINKIWTPWCEDGYKDKLEWKWVLLRNKGPNFKANCPTWGTDAQVGPWSSPRTRSMLPHHSFFLLWVEAIHTYRAETKSLVTLSNTDHRNASGWIMNYLFMLNMSIGKRACSLSNSVFMISVYNGKIQAAWEFIGIEEGRRGQRLELWRTTCKRIIGITLSITSKAA